MSKINLKTSKQKTKWQLGDIVLTPSGSLWKVYEDIHTGTFYMLEFNSNVFCTRDAYDSIEEMQCELGEPGDLIVDIEITTSLAK